MSAISREEVADIARVLQFNVDFFEWPDMVVALGGDFLYRRRARVNAKVRRRVEAEANIRKLQVQQLLKSATVQATFAFPAIDLVEVNESPQRAAQLVRETWRTSSGPVKIVARAIEGAGSTVFNVDFETDSIDGTNIRLPGLPPLLFVNGKMPSERYRFSLAHELAHAVMHFSIVSGDAEAEAYAFAREFLLPKKEVRSDLKGLDLAAVARLKPLWGRIDAPVDL